jgi:hypothetical protein
MVQGRIDGILQRAESVLEEEGVSVLGDEERETEVVGGWRRLWDAVASSFAYVIRYCHPVWTLYK